MSRTAKISRTFAYSLLATVVVLMMSHAVAAGYPKPAPVPFRWELNFEAGDLRLYVDEETKDAYWYFTYTVTNRTGKDQLWAPTFVLYTDAGEILQAGRDVPANITEDLLELLGNELLQDQLEIVGDILQGQENAKEGLVVWPAKETKVNDLSMFVAGLSGETARVKNPVTDQEVILRKTLQRDYLIPGNAVARGSQPIEMITQTWILR
jgi:hypothetical protein